MSEPEDPLACWQRLLDLGPISSSAHLADGPAPALSEVEYGLMVAAHAFHRWMVRCMAAAGEAGLSSTEVMILHSVCHRSRAKRMADVALVLDIEDLHIVSYAVKKLEMRELLTTRKAGKEKLVEISAKGREVCERYAMIRHKILVESLRYHRPDEKALSEQAALLRFLSGAYTQAARAATTF